MLFRSRATDGRQPILDVVPGSLHARTPLAIGSRQEVELYERFQAEDAG